MVGAREAGVTRGGKAYQERNAIMNPRAEKKNMRPCLSMGLRRGMVRALKVVGCRAGAVQSVWSFMLDAVGSPGNGVGGTTPTQHRGGGVNYVVFGGEDISQEFLVSKYYGTPRRRSRSQSRCLCHGKCTWRHVSCATFCGSISESRGIEHGSCIAVGRTI